MTSTLTRTATPTNTPIIAIQVILNVPSTAVVNQQLTIVLAVNNNGNIALTNVTPAPANPVFSGGTSLAVVATPATGVTIAPSSSAGFTWVYNVVAPGTVQFQAGVTSSQGSSLTPATGSVNCMNPTPTATVTQTMVASGTQEVYDILPYPNPYNPGMTVVTSGANFQFKLKRYDVDKIGIKIYTAAYRLIIEKDYDGAEKDAIVGQSYMTIAARTLSRLANGTYYYYIYVTGKDGKTTKSKVDMVVILK